MISIRHAANELERQEMLQQATLDSHIGTVRLMGRCALEVNRDITLAFRNRLEKIAERLQRTRSPEELRGTQSEIQQEANVYYEESSRRLGRLRNDFSDAARALSELVSSINSSNEDHEQLLDGELTRLTDLTLLSDPTDIRRQLQQTVQRLGDCVKKIRAENRLVFAQMRDEIRTLQERVAAAESQSAGQSSFNPPESPLSAEEMTRSWIEKGRNFCALFVSLQSHLPRRGSPAPESAFAAIQAELASNLPAGANVGPWGADSICAIAETDKNTMLVISKIIPMLIASLNIPGRPAGIYGASGVVEFRAGENLASFLRRSGALIAALRASG